MPVAEARKSAGEAPAPATVPPGPGDAAMPEPPTKVAPIPRKWGHRIMFATVRHVLAVLLLLVFALRVWNQRRALDEPSYILLANHQSYVDPFFLGAASPWALHFMARDNLFRPGLKQLIELAGAFPVTRGRRDERAFHHAQGLLAAGNSLVMFGEGTRTRDGNLQPLRGGIEIISRRTGATIVPMALDGPYHLAPRTRSMRYLTAEAVHVAIGRPIRESEYAAWPERGIPERLHPRLDALLTEARRRRAAASRGGLLALSRPAVEAIAAYFRLLTAPLRWLRPAKPKPSASPQP